MLITGLPDRLWAALYPAEQTRIIQLLVERVSVGKDGFAVDLRHQGLGPFLRDLAPRQTEGPACAARHRPRLELAAAAGNGPRFHDPGHRGGREAHPTVREPDDAARLAVARCTRTPRHQAHAAGAVAERSRRRRGAIVGGADECGVRTSAAQLQRLPAGFKIIRPMC